MKTSNPKSFHFRLRPIACIATFCLISGGAAAQTVRGKITVDGVVQGTQQTGLKISDSISQSAATASYIGDASTGVFNVSAAHSGQPGSTETELTFTNTVTNSLQTAQNVSFSFHVFSGSISALHGLDASGASFSSNIVWGSQSLWATKLDITNGIFYIRETPTSTITNSTAAADFVYTTSSPADDYSTYTVGWGDYSKTLGLGILNPGESKTLTYTMSTLSYSGPNNYAGYGGGAGFGGDPLSFDFSPVPTGVPTGVTLAAVATVPEPSTYAMMGLGLAMMGAAIKRRRKQGHAVNPEIARS